MDSSGMSSSADLASFVKEALATPNDIVLESKRILGLND